MACGRLVGLVINDARLCVSAAAVVMVRHEGSLIVALMFCVIKIGILELGIAIATEPIGIGDVIN